MLAVTRFRMGPDEESAFVERARDALAALAARPGYVRGHLGRSTDEPGLWVLFSEWVGVGAYRRALSSYDVKIRAVPLLSLAVDEPSAYEIVSSVDAAPAAVGPTQAGVDTAEPAGPGEPIA